MQRRILHYIFLLVVLAIFGCENNPQEIDTLSRKVIEVEEGKNIKAIYSQAAVIKATLTAPVMQRVKADTQYVAFPQTIHVDFYDSLHRVESTVDARYARYFEVLGKVLLKDSVLVRNVSGDTLDCKTLWWDQMQESFYTDDSVLIRTPQQHIRGTGFWAKSDFSKYTIRNTAGSIVLPNQKDSTAPTIVTDTTAAKPVPKQ